MRIEIELDEELAARLAAQAEATTRGDLNEMVRLCLLQSLNPQQFQQEVQAYAAK